MSYRNKTFVSFDGDSDMHYYRLMTAWKQSDNISFNFYDAHDLNSARDSSLEQSIKNQLADRLRNSKVFVLLVGENTRYLYKFVRWEIEQAIKREMPIVAVNLNGKRSMDRDRCPPLLANALAIHVSFNAAILHTRWNTGPHPMPPIEPSKRAGPTTTRKKSTRGLDCELATSVLPSDASAQHRLGQGAFGIAKFLWCAMAMRGNRRPLFQR